MSRGTPTTPATGNGLDDRRTRRGASVTLRQDGAAQPQNMSDLMDPANKSLADALKIAYRLLQLAILIMLAIYALSGFQTITEGERGVRTLFGQITDRTLSPGFQPSWPQPIGNIERFDIGEQRLELKREFFPNLNDNEEKMLAEKREQALANGGSDALDPDADGQLLTADGFIVHTRWQVTYRRTPDARSLLNVAQDPDRAADARGRSSIERQIVTAAVRRGIVHAAAQLTIDEVLYSQPDPARTGDFRPMQQLARDEAQRMLDQIEAGVEIQQLNMTEKMPPRRVIPQFNQVQSAQAAAGQKIQEAEGLARQTLAAAAGEGAPVLLAQIDRYEKQFEAGQSEASQTFDTIRDLMLRKPVTVDGTQVDARVSGNVSRTLSDAEQYRTSVVARAQSDANVFSAKLQAYKSNPEVFLSGEWSDAFRTFLKQTSVQALFLPSTAERTVVQINKDPELAKAIAKELAEAEALKAQQDRDAKRRRQFYENRLDGTNVESGS